MGKARSPKDLNFVIGVSNLKEFSVETKDLLGWYKFKVSFRLGSEAQRRECI